MFGPSPSDRKGLSFPSFLCAVVDMYVCLPRSCLFALQYFEYVCDSEKLKTSNRVHFATSLIREVAALLLMRCESPSFSKLVKTSAHWKWLSESWVPTKGQRRRVKKWHYTSNDEGCWRWSAEEVGC
ncbi:uncharacterized protein LOC105172448 [Sesamum indicum]|uniref:Uncharacterized protein LOC105172448 n=1 Tax=Sesamum indicum TaxID=4182 RepID=A0A8M8V8K7_SESIN|nr:uncharacterized protein LOC105172448 [Sesamum indicum]